MLLAEQVHGLVLADLHAGAHVAVPVQEEGEGAGQVLTAKATAEKKSEVQNFYKLVSVSVVFRHFLTICSLMEVTKTPFYVNRKKMLNVCSLYKPKEKSVRKQQALSLQFLQSDTLYFAVLKKFKPYFFTRQKPVI